MILPNARTDRLLLLRFGVEPQRIHILQLLARATEELRDREGACDVLVDATWVGGIDLTLDVEFLSWIVLHYAQVRHFAIVVDDLECCAARVQKLELLAGKTFGVFIAEAAAKAWIRDRPWPDDA